MKSDIGFIYFDAGGVLLDYLSAWKTTMDSINIPLTSLKKSYKKHEDELNTGKMEFDEIFEIIKKQHKIKIDSNYDVLWEISKNQKPINETHKLVNEIKDDFRLGVLSNASNKMVDYSITHGNIPKIDWDKIIDSSQVGYAKPDPVIYKYATEKSKVESNQILFIDDLKENILEANNTGWKTIWFDFLNPKKSVEEIRKILDK